MNNNNNKKFKMPTCEQVFQQIVSSAMYISMLFVVVVLCNSKLTQIGVLCKHVSSIESPYFYQNKPTGPIAAGGSPSDTDGLLREDYQPEERKKLEETYRPHHLRHQIHRHYIHSSSANSKQQRKARAVYLATLAENSNKLNHSSSSSSSGSSNITFSNSYQNDQSPILDQCCACDEAKYELVFEGLWSRYTHPDDFPENYWLAHFSDIIGASHSNEFRMWSQDSYASEGVRELAETGSTKKLESELKLVSAKTRTIIKARELHYPTLNSKTSAVFRTDRLHHLVSILSKLGPSPDWMVGVSALELCQSDCSWASQRVVNLYLWDAGTDSGISFTSADLPTRPQDKIQPFKKVSQVAALVGAATTTTRRPDLSMAYESSNFQRRSFEQQQQQQQMEPLMMNSNGDSSSSSSSSANLEQIKPYARLTITRQRIYEKSCGEHQSPTIMRNPSSGSVTSFPPDQWPDTSPSYSDCRVTDWSDWSSCSTICGKGLRSRVRSFVDDRANADICPGILLIEKETCLSECRGKNTTCVTKDWSEWSNCSVNCGQGFRKRTRSPIGYKRKACESVEFVEKEPCTGSLDPNCQEDFQPCEVSEWSPWSNCSVACGKGIRFRTRSYAKKESSQNCSAKLLQKQSCLGKQEHCQQRGPALTPPGSNPNLPVIDCKLSPWGPWSTCSALCGFGKRLRSRFIVQLPQNGGKACDKKLTRTQRCKNLPPCPPSDYHNNQEQQQQQQLSSSQLGPQNNNRNMPVKHGNHKQIKGASEWRITSTTTTTQGSSMLDDEDDSKFSRLLQTESDSLQSSSFTSNVSAITDGTSAALSDMELIADGGGQQEVNKPCDYGNWTEWSRCEVVCSPLQLGSKRFRLRHPISSQNNTCEVIWELQYCDPSNYC